MTRSMPGPVTGASLAITVPLVGNSSPAIKLSSVDLPQPLAPSKQTNSPCLMSRSIGVSASTLRLRETYVLPTFLRLRASWRVMQVHAFAATANKIQQVQVPDSRAAERVHDVRSYKNAPSKSINFCASILLSAALSHCRQIDGNNANKPSNRRRGLGVRKRYTRRPHRIRRWRGALVPVQRLISHP